MICDLSEADLNSLLDDFLSASAGSTCPWLGDKGTVWLLDEGEGVLWVGEGVFREGVFEETVRGLLLFGDLLCGV